MAGNTGLNLIRNYDFLTFKFMKENLCPEMKVFSIRLPETATLLFWIGQLKQQLIKIHSIFFKKTPERINSCSISLTWHLFSDSSKSAERCGIFVWACLSGFGCCYFIVVFVFLFGFWVCFGFAGFVVVVLVFLLFCLVLVGP